MPQIPDLVATKFKREPSLFAKKKPRHPIYVLNADVEG
jgi:hypothetical protein